MASADPSTTSAPALVDAANASSESDAVTLAVTYDHPVVVDSDTTTTEQVSAESDGSLELVEDSEPVRVQQNGTWVPVDTSLVLGADGMLVPQASAVPVEFSSGGSGPLARVLAADGSWLSESWPSGLLPAPSVSAGSATYANVFPGVDLELTATSTGMSSVLIVHDATAAADPQLADVQLAISGTTISAVSGTGGADATAAAESSNGLASASPSWWDSSQPESDASGPGGLASPQPVPGAVDASSLTLDARAVAQSSGVTYPVYVDPDWTGGVDDRTFTDSAYPSQSYWNGAGASDSYQHVGYVQASWSDDGNSHTTRSFWKMDLSKVAGKKILSAEFNTDEIYASSCNKREVDLYTTGAISSSTTWNSKTAFSTKLAAQTVAYGYDSSCPAHSVGFTATSGVSAAVAAGASYLTLGLKAADESDTLTWKKFKAATTLTISYDSYPGTPSGLSVGGCGFVCASPAYSKDSTPALTATASDPDGGNLNYTFSIYQGQSATLPAVYKSGTVSNVASGTKATFTAPTLPQGAYEYRVTASDGTVSGPASGLFKFTVDTTVPAAPKLSESGGLSINPDAPAGTVGVTPETVTISPATASDDTYGYAYAIFPSTSTVIFPKNLVCNTSTAGYTTVCPGTVNAAKAVTITAPDDQSTFAAVSFDAAGNTYGTAPAGTHVSFSALADTASMSAGHSWVTDPASAACPGGQPGPVPDSAAQGSTPATAQNLTLAGDTCWGEDDTAPNTSGGLGAGVLSFTGAAGESAATSTGVLNTTKSYTVAAWVYPTQVTTVADAMGQDGSGDSAFFLQQDAGVEWQFCVSSADTSGPWQGACAVTPAGSVQSNQWVFVVGQYNATDHTVTLRLSNSNGVGLGTPIITSLGSVAATFTGGTQIGRAFIYGAYRNWTGHILDPVAIQGTADTGQLQQLMQLTAPNQVTTTGSN